MSMEELSNTISKLSENIKGDFGETSEDTMKAMLDESMAQKRDNEELDAVSIVKNDFKCYIICVLKIHFIRQNKFF